MLLSGFPLLQGSKGGIAQWLECLSSNRRVAASILFRIPEHDTEPLITPWAAQWLYTAP